MVGVKVKKIPVFSGPGLGKIGDDILFRNECSIICANGLNYSVRNGKR